MTKPSAALSAAAVAALHEGRKIDAVKIVRAETALDLEAALALIDERLRSDAMLRGTVEAVRAESSRRAMPVLVVAGLLVLLAAYVVFGH